MSINVFPSAASTSSIKPEKDGSSFGAKILPLIKTGALSLIGVVLSWTAVYFLKSFFDKGDNYAIVGAASAAFGFLVAAGLQPIFLKSGKGLIFFSLFSAAAPLAVWFLNPIAEIGAYPSKKNLLVLLGSMAFFFIWLLIGLLRGRSVYENGLKIHFFSIAKTSVPKAISAILVAGSAVFYLSYLERGSFQPALSAKIYDVFWSGFNPALEVFVPGASVNDSVGSILERAAKTQVEQAASNNESLLENFNLNLSDFLPSLSKAEVVSQTAKELKKILEEKFGAFSEEEPLKDFGKRLIESYGAKFLERPGARPIFGAAAAFLMFAVLKSASFFIAWLIEFSAFLVYKFLIAFGFGYISLETARKETIVV